MGSERQRAKKKQTERSDKNKPNARKQGKRKVGAPFGSRNAAGHGAPKGTRNHFIHGGYSNVYWDTLGEDERAMIEETPQDEEELLLNQIRLFDVRERRIMTAINKYRVQENNGGLSISGVRSYHTKREFENEDERIRYEELKRQKIDEGKISYVGYDKSTSTDTEASINVIQRLERELSTVQRVKTQCIEALNRIRQSREGAKGNDIASDWIAALLGVGDADE